MTKFTIDEDDGGTWSRYRLVVQTVWFGEPYEYVWCYTRSRTVALVWAFMHTLLDPWSLVTVDERKAKGGK